MPRRTHQQLASVTDLHLDTEPWTIDAGLITPTLKVKRPAMEQRFADEIAALYQHRYGSRAAAGQANSNHAA